MEWKGKIVYASGDIYEGDMSNGVREGKGKMVFVNGNTYKRKELTGGSWNGSDHGGNVKIGEVQEGRFKNDEKEGRNKVNKKKETNDENWNGRHYDRNGDEHRGL
jgi:hypothetical protein